MTKGSLYPSLPPDSQPQYLGTPTPRPTIPSMNILTLLLIQLDRIRGAPSVHAAGPKKPTLTQQDLGLGKVK